jgi:hypothetical protein
MCDLPTTATPPVDPAQFSTDPKGVLLSPTGDFQINGTLAPLPPVTCVSPMLLIRNAAAPAMNAFPNPWFAVGIYSPSNQGNQGNQNSQGNQNNQH